MESDDSVKWFAMRATYGRNMMAQRTLDIANIESFVPTRKRTLKVGRRIKTEFAPLVRDLIFVKATKAEVQEAKAKMSYLHYITFPVDGRNVPIDVPDEQMENFIRVCSGEVEVEPLVDDVEYSVGDNVRIKQGALSGTVGRLVRIHGRRDSRFYVSIEGVCAITAKVGRDELEKIEN